MTLYCTDKVIGGSKKLGGSARLPVHRRMAKSTRMHAATNAEQPSGGAFDSCFCFCPVKRALTLKYLKMIVVLRDCSPMLSFRSPYNENSMHPLII